MSSTDAMTALSLNNPGPAVTTPGSNSRRAGAPNPMVGVNTIPDTVPDRVTVEFVRTRLSGQTHRFMTASRSGLAVHVGALTDLVTEIVTEHTAEHTAGLRAELDAANDAVVELIGQHDAAVRALDAALGSRAGGA
ncbi:hypothetical protein [Actinophytocola gossypii]|uniref:Uncharacterized protein n=1 Tax=Actinophytocola gossypii TaxID=2812003 RepID=A0ABT2JIR0_9PSEU|nr:hypothetical protein [Actinophytocola gossypii]MCT2587777.1 hypothetical protein [Actinophytocola gossypii]